MADPGLRERFEELRATDFRRLDEGGHVYLDYTGSGLYAESQLRGHETFLEHHLLGNPHSENPASLAATEVVESTRRAVLDFFGADADEHVVIFTANASGALKLVGEAFPFRPGSRFVLPRDSHNSVNGITEYAETRGGTVTYLPLDDELRLPSGVEIPPAGEASSLFAYPAQSNFSGVQHPLEMVEAARGQGYRVVLDAAAFVPTNPLDLSQVPADFTCISFYKMFGFPTGVGALVARKEALAGLERPWFAGGTVEFVSVQNRLHRLVAGPEAFEDGTLNFLGIAAVRAGLAFLEDVGMADLKERVKGLTRDLLEILQGASHPGGEPLVDIYGPRSTEARGGTVSFNVLDAEGRVVPYGVVEREASAQGISLRGGCFCNPGAAEVAFGLPAGRMAECFQATDPGGFSLPGLAECLDHSVPVGALRASVGIATNQADLARFGHFLADLAARQPPLAAPSAASS